MKRPALLLFLLFGGFSACKSLPKQDGATLAVLFDLERKLPGAAIDFVRSGVVYARWTGPGPLFVHVLAMDTRRQDLYLKPILGSGRMDGAPDTWEPLDVMARRAGALAAVSADYPKGPLNVSGFTVLDGAVHLAPKPPKRSSLLVSRSGKVSFGKYEDGRIGAPAYYQAVTGGPILFEGGRFVWKKDEAGRINGEEMPFLASVLDEPQARGALCLLGNGVTLYWIHVENRQEDRSGASPEALGELLTKLQCREGLLLAGGRYAGLSLKGRLLGNTRGNGTPIGNALGLFERKAGN